MRTADPLQVFLLSSTKHKAGCRRHFGRYDATCPRCQELMAGAQARPGWQANYFPRKRREEAQRSEAIRAHFAPGGKHDRGECGPVCTFGDW